MVGDGCIFRQIMGRNFVVIISMRVLLLEEILFQMVIRLMIRDGGLLMELFRQNH